MTGLAQLIKKARNANRPQDMVDAMPYCGYLGLRAAAEGDDLIVTLPFDDGLVGNPVISALHGGVTGGALESTAILKLLWARDSADLPKIINITIEYLRSPRPIDTFARAVITKMGRRVASVRVEAWQQERQKQIAIANTHFLLIPPQAGRSNEQTL